MGFQLVKKYSIFFVIICTFSSPIYSDLEPQSFDIAIEKLNTLDISAAQKLYDELAQAVKKEEAKSNQSRATQFHLQAVKVFKYLKKLKNRAKQISADAKLISQIHQEWAQEDIDYRYYGKPNQKELMNAVSKTFREDREILNKNETAIKNHIEILSKQRGELENFLKKAKENNNRAEEQALKAQIDTLDDRIWNFNYAKLRGTPDSLDNSKLEKEYDWVNGNPPTDETKKQLQAFREKKAQEKRFLKEVEKKAATADRKLQKEDTGVCPAAEFLWGSGKSDWGLLGTIGEGITETPGAFLSLYKGISEYGAPIKSGFYTIFSAMAHYQYSQKGSKNSATQTWRGLAIGLGIDMQAKGQSPLMPIDPLQGYKREPVAIQNVWAQQKETLRNVLTIGGNAYDKAGYPYTPHDRLQQILQASAPGGSFPGTPIFDPNYRNFVGQAYNGFPPPAGVATQGAFLNPQFGAQSPFYSGSGIASNNFSTIDEAAGLRAMASLTGATQVQRQGIENFANQLGQINPPDNSLKSLIDDVGRIQAQRAGLTAQDTFLNQIDANSQNIDFLNNLLVQQYALLNEQYRNLGEINQKIWDASLEFRHADLKIQRDEDGLMIGGPKDWSRHMRVRNDTLNKLQELRNQRAQALEKVALIRQHPAIYYRMITNVPKEPAPNSPMSFFISNGWAQETPQLLPNWRKTLKEEKAKVQLALNEKQNKLKTLLPKLKSLVQLDPNGVHEINLAVLQVEEINMKAIALQAKQNLEVLNKMGKNDRIFEQYREILTKLHKEAKRCAEQLEKVEALQIKKVEQYDTFDHFKVIGNQMLQEFASL